MTKQGYVVRSRGGADLFLSGRRHNRDYRPFAQAKVFMRKCDAGNSDKLGHETDVLPVNITLAVPAIA